MIHTANAAKAADAIGPGAHMAQNLQMMSQTVFSGADPALADVAGTSAIVQGTYPTDYNKAVSASWLTAIAPGVSSLLSPTPVRNGTPAQPTSGPASATPSPSFFTSTALAVLAIGLVLIGAVAIVMPGAMRTAEG